MKRTLRNGTAILALLVSLGGCSPQNNLTTLLKTKQITQKNTPKEIRQTWKTNLKKLRQGEELAFFSPTSTFSPFTLDLSSILNPTYHQDLDCIDFHPPYLYDFSVQLIENEYDALRNEIVDFAKNYLGLRYRSAGTSPKTGFDCSGFTHFIMKNFDVAISASSRTQATEGEKISLEQAQKGDLLFFGYRSKNGYWRVNHAAMVVSEEGDDLAMIHACRRGIVIDDIHSSSWKSYYQKRFLFAKRVLQNNENQGTTSKNHHTNAAQNTF